MQIATKFITVSLIRTFLPITVTMDVNLYEEVMEGKFDVLRQHIDQIENQVTPNNNIVLHVVAQFGRLQCVEEILKECPIQSTHRYCAKELDRELESGGRATKEILRSTNEDKNTTLHTAVWNEHLNLVKLLTREDPEFQHPANNVDETPLYLATEIGCVDVVSEILGTYTSLAYGGPWW
ncbi:hypothetical protein ACSBR2_030745 [Camellia fascicularis]